MPRVSEIDGDRGDPTLQPIFAKDRELFGGPPNPTKNVALGIEAQGFCVIAANPATAPPTMEEGVRR
jgi:hypothetical protein